MITDSWAFRKMAVSLAGFLCATASALPLGFSDQAVLGNWDRAAGVAFAPDGRCFVWEKAGRVWTVENGVRSAQPLIDIHNEVRDFGDYGLLGFALDPSFLTNGRVYLLYSVDYYYLTRFNTPGYDPNQSNVQRDCIGRLTRYTCKASDGFHSIDPASRKVLVGESISTGFPQLFQSHGVGTLAFGEDGSLFAGSGDSASFLEVDNGGPRTGSSNTALADGVISQKEDIGAFRSQLVDSLAGKIIRISPETGDGLPGNPFYEAGSPRAAKSRVWAMGLRNPYRFSLRPGSATPTNPAGVLYIGDVGWDTHEEINIARTPGLNFGWPIFEGLEPHPGYTATTAFNLDAANPLGGGGGGGGGCGPFFAFKDLLIQETHAAPSWPNPCQPAAQVPASLHRFMHTRPAIEWGHGHATRVPIFAGELAAAINITDPNSPVIGPTIVGSCALGGVWYTGTAFGPEYQNTYFMADFVSGTVKNFVVHTADDDVEAVRDFQETGGPVVCMAVNPIDGSLYYIAYSYNGASTLRRIARTSNLPPIVKATASVTFGPAPLTVSFSTDGTSDPENHPLTYLWSFGDGSNPSSLPNPVHVFSAPGPGPIRYDVSLRVWDGTNQVLQKFLISPNNTPPNVSITSPIDRTVLELQASTPVALQAVINDDPSPLGSLVCSWQRILHHNSHTHPDPAVAVCQSVSDISLHGTTGDLYYFEFILTVTDPQGLSTSKSALVYPVACIADLNGDGQVDDPDFSIFVLSYNLLDCADPEMPTWCHADLNRDGFVDDADFSVFVGSYDRLICP